MKNPDTLQKILNWVYYFCGGVMIYIFASSYMIPAAMWVALAMFWYWQSNQWHEKYLALLKDPSRRN